MSNASVELVGAKELRKTLRAAGDDLKELKAANKAAADIAAAASAALAPVRTGKLRSTLRTSGTNTAGIIRAGTKASPYAAPIHWGWERYLPSQRRRGIRGGTIKGQPFISDGAVDSEGRWLPEYIRTVDGIVNRVTGK